MGEVENICDLFDSSGEEHGDEQLMIAAESVIREKSTELTDFQKTPEKRMRTDSEEIVEDDDGFVTVRKNSKRLARRISRRSTEDEENNANLEAADKIIVSITSKEILPKQFGLAKKLRAEKIDNILNISYKNPYKVLIEFENKTSAQKLLDCENFLALGYRCQWINVISLCYGVVKNIDLDIDDKEFQESLECEYQVISVRRLKRLIDTEGWVDSESWNAQSLKPKLEEFKLLLLQERVHIALISETWLAPEVILNISKYNVYRRDRDDSYGGIAIITHESIKAQELSSLYEHFIQQVNRAACDSIPMKKICFNPSNNFRPKGYWCQTISKLVAERRLALAKFRKNPTPNNLDMLKEKILNARRAIHKAKSKDWQTFCDSIDHTLSVSQMWDKMRWIKGYKRCKDYISIDSQSELLRSLTPDYVMPSPPCFFSLNQSLEAEFSMGEMRGCFKKKDTAPGEDMITYSMISQLPETGQLYLLNLYNLILKFGCVPTQWRNIKVIAIPKSDASSDSNNKLRPISLISCICKIFHTMLARRLEWFVERNEILSPSTTGFRRGQSCLDCLARLVTDIQIGLTKNSPTLACFLDIKSAYNNVLIEKMLQTLDTLKVGKSICQYLWNFLSERRLKITDVAVEGREVVRTARNGLAQGDPISPLLFNIATFEICRDIAANINVCQYADDFVLYTTGNSILESANRMQASLNMFTEILTQLGLEVSTSKSHYCIFSRGRRTQQLNLSINYSSLGLVDTYKYLGIWLDSSLKWSKHIDEMDPKVM
ncbi:hypothetical protein HW555_006857 [Spodoptera exigua]|uniref:Reverse transcriptase domain-containing protein n=1 Tax=Spodoptera exigua TaxID=7107 RepID=A0A835GHX7_SPOEX|nr:hypothetical protein HW555_006857 [Spodoptera exigua]